jgi:hypothetical protein
MYFQTLYSSGKFCSSQFKDRLIAVTDTKTRYYKTKGMITTQVGVQNEDKTD